MPPCDDDGEEPDDCSSAEKIAEREEMLNDAKTAGAQLKIDIENKTKALDDLKAKSQLLNQAISDYDEQKDQREQLAFACREFHRCKKPQGTTPEDEQCVKDVVEACRSKLLEHWTYVDRLTRAVGRARVAVKRAERRYDWAEEHFERIRSQAVECLTKCEDLKAKFVDAETANDQCLMFLYWHEIGELLENADCLDEEKFRAHLCCAFDWAIKAKHELNEALLAQDRLERQLDRAEQAGKVVRGQQVDDHHPANRPMLLPSNRADRDPRSRPIRRIAITLGLTQHNGPRRDHRAHNLRPI